MEGDLVVPRTRNALICWNNACLWKKSSKGKVEVPYTVSSSFSSYEKGAIETAMSVFSTQTCITFVPRSSESDYVAIENRDGCFSSLGRTGGRQELSLNRDGCVYHGIIQHELNHALGFYHEHTRSDRDQYVTINWKYIDPAQYHNFEKQRTNNQGTPYDYSSVMHYGRTLFHTINRATIENMLVHIIPVWYAGSTVADLKRLQRVIRAVEKVIGCPLPSLDAIASSRCLTRARMIIKDHLIITITCSTYCPLGEGSDPSGAKQTEQRTASSHGQSGL
ncbi:hypothetical protein ACEWY4_026594 [Coilia grayii]|uniref:Metalloendopeptidase n=1 Tax=Coilia grayii TaxID=363190 RepID=A0ABD1IQ09_9TELE